MFLQMDGKWLNRGIKYLLKNKESTVFTFCYFWNTLNLFPLPFLSDSLLLFFCMVAFLYLLTIFLRF